tara:strand:+ start:1737 stop:2564 length:828 start_codon:yes stop_codon:yes gene_type:complete
MSRIRANTITNQNANGAPNFPNGISVSVASTFSGNVSIGGTLTYEDVTNVDSVGLITARSGIKIGPTAGVAGTFFADGSYITAGIVTASSFRGDGSQLTGIDASSLKSGGVVKVQANSHGAVTTGVMTATSFSGNGAALTGIQGIPSGVIMMWSGTIASIPSGFVLCDGSNSTPDLRDKFIVGAKQDDSGTAMSNITGSLASTGGNTSFTTSQEGSHMYTGTEDNPNQVQDASSSYNGIQNKNSRDRHQHGIDWRHTHTVTAIPSFYALAYIMKT